MDMEQTRTAALLALPTERLPDKSDEISNALQALLAKHREPAYDGDRLATRRSERTGSAAYTEFDLAAWRAASKHVALFLRARQHGMSFVDEKATSSSPAERFQRDYHALYRG